jgi:hypothetical protein
MSKPLKYILHLDNHVMFQNGMQRVIADLTDDYRIIHFQHPNEALNYIETSFENGNLLLI